MLHKKIRTLVVLDLGFELNENKGVEMKHTFCIGMSLDKIYYCYIYLSFENKLKIINHNPFLLQSK